MNSLIIRIKNNINLINKIIFYIIAIVIIIAGIYWRTKEYLNAYPLWMDEISMVLNILHKNLPGMFTQLIASQKAPPLFMALSYIFTKIGGYNVLSYRFVAYFSSILSLFAFFILSLRIFKSKFPIIMGLYIFSTCHALIYYARELKPYSSDVLVCLLLLLCLYSKVFDFKEISVKQIILCSFLSIVCILLSFPAIFILSAILFFKTIENKTVNIKTYILAGIIFSTCVYLFLLYKDLMFEQEIFEPAWQIGFLKLSFESIYNIAFDFITFLKNGLINETQIVFIIMFMITGAVLFLIEKNKYAILMLVIFLFACIGSYFKFYPLTGRIMLYFTPILIYFAVKPLDCSIELLGNKASSIAKFVLLSIMLLFCFNSHCGILQLPDSKVLEYRESTEDRNTLKNAVITFINNYNYKENERILSSGLLEINADYYSLELFSKKLTNITDLFDEKTYDTVIELIRNNKNFWILTEFPEDKLLNDPKIKNLLIEKNYSIEKFCEKEICSYHIFKQN